MEGEFICLPVLYQFLMKTGYFFENQGLCVFNLVSYLLDITILHNVWLLADRIYFDLRFFFKFYQV